MSMYRLAIICLVLFTLCPPTQPVQAQYSSVSQLMAAKKAKLVLAVKAGPVLNGYSKPDPNNPDASTGHAEVIFDVLEVLKGVYTKKEISVLYADHMGLNDKSNWILIVDDKVDLLSGGEKKGLRSLLKKWPDKYVSSPEWLIPYNDEELKVVKDWIDYTNKRGAASNKALQRRP